MSPSGRGSRFLPFGSVALNPAAISGVTIMKMISSTSMTSIIGVTLMSALTEPTARRYPWIWPLPVTAFWAWNSLVKIERPNSLPTLLMR